MSYDVSRTLKEMWKPGREAGATTPGFHGLQFLLEVCLPTLFSPTSQQSKLVLDEEKNLPLGRVSRQH